jgi:hypothetical protein
MDPTDPGPSEGCYESLKFNAGIIDYISCPKIWPCLVRTGVRKCWIK